MRDMGDGIKRGTDYLDKVLANTEAASDEMHMRIEQRARARDEGYRPDSGMARRPRAGAA